MLFKTKGMNQDLSVSAFNPEFSFENMNLRLSTNESNTMMSWVNEKGTAEVEISLYTYTGEEISPSKIVGSPLGTAVLNQQLVLFTHENNNVDYIYVFKYSNDEKTAMSGRLLYSGNLNFNIEHPIETLVRYEDDSIQKVYWTDGYNQPRLINIAAPNSTIAKWNTTNEDSSVSTFFDFVPAMSTWGSLDVEKITSGGTFAPGVIQYCFTYVNNYGQQSNIIQVSPLFYIAYSDRGANPEDKVTNSFKIALNNLDTNFDAVKVYSIQRTSIDGDAIVREIDTLPIIPTSFTNPIHDYDFVDADYENIALPYVYNSSTSKYAKVLKVTLKNGTYHNNIVIADPTYIPSGFIGDENDVYFTDNNEHTYTLNQFTADFKTAFHDKKYFNYLKFTSDIATAIRQKNDWGSLFYKFGTDSNLQIEYSLYGKYLVYDYETQLWYVATEIPTTDVTTEEEVISEPMVLIDNGTTGSSVDPYELLFIGGKEVSVLTMTEKDGTLFMGNIEEKNFSVSLIQKYFNSIRGTADKINIQFTNTDDSKKITLDIPTSHYNYNSMLGNSMKDITTFKGRETYRFGFQLQRKTGEWSEPIFLSDELNTLYPNIYPNCDSNSSDTEKILDNQVNLVCAKASISVEKLRQAIGEDLYAQYNRIRPLVVYPNVNDRSVLCQGVLNPTVFNVEDRVTNSPFAQSSWYFRPYLQNHIADVPTTGYDYSIMPTEERDTESELKDTALEDYGLSPVFVMVVRVTDSQRMYVDRPGTISGTKISYYQDYNSRSETRTFDVITSFELIDTIGKNVFALVSKSQWEIAQTINYTPQGGGSLIKEEFKYNNFKSTQILGYCSMSQVYTDLVKSSSTVLHYIRPAGEAPVEAKIMFTIWLPSGLPNPYAGNRYIIHYPMCNSASHIYNTVLGTDVKFKHYDSLPSDASNEDKTEVEIQGSANKYGTVYDESASGNSNTQFFIDQSIVTMHSPDIEFDSDVQNFSGEGLGLRIVGIVPITGSASNHKITHTAMSPNSSGQLGSGETSSKRLTANLNYIASKKLVTEAFWSDIRYENEGSPDSSITYYKIYPWQKQGSLNNDWRQDSAVTSKLITKKESNILYSFKSEYKYNSIFPKIDTKMCLQENSQVYNVRLKRQRDNDKDINYYPNIDKVLVNPEGYKLFYSGSGDKLYYNPISMKYKSGSHAVIALLQAQGSPSIPVLPHFIHKYWDSQTQATITDYIGKLDQHLTENHYVFWDIGNQQYNAQGQLDLMNCAFHDFNFLLLGELYRPDSSIINRFGGTSDAAIKANKWQVAGDAISVAGEPVIEQVNGVDTVVDTVLNLKWTYGDTYYQRYDSLKTYAFTNEDTNQLVEILSFMCETHVNADGRYDRNRGQIDNTTMSPQNFNLMNSAYSQKDNFFTYRISNTDTQKNNKYPNQVIWSKTKNSSSDVDIWTNVTLANSLELDGDKGQVRKLTRLNDQLICFQDTGISQILYNENVQISSTQGVPIELANSGKVQGKRYLSDTVGCSNKWSVVQTPAGIYFMDSNDKGIYRLGQGLQNLSQQCGFNTWCKQNIPATEKEWYPSVFDNFVGYYDRQNQDVLFINQNTALAYSEKFGVFTSFYDYGKVPYFVNFNDSGLWITNPYRKRMGGVYINYPCKLWKHQAGDYCSFFGKTKPYWITLVGNPEPQQDKIFTNLEFRASVEGDGEYIENTDKFAFSLPFDSLETWNDYQHGIAKLSIRNSYTHHTIDNNASLKRRFRIWRCDVPRDNAELDTDKELGISRIKKHPVDRMRNPWLYLKLQKDADTDKKVEIHDIVMTYFT